MGRNGTLICVKAASIKSVKYRSIGRHVLKRTENNDILAVVLRDDSVKAFAAGWGLHLLDSGKSKVGRCESRGTWNDARSYSMIMHFCHFDSTIRTTIFYGFLDLDVALWYCTMTYSL